MERTMTTDSKDLQIIFDALCFASQMHSKQRRKGNQDTPYINHPIDVARMLVTVGGITDPDVLAAALLHDTIEDTEATEEELTGLFGKKITKLVLECTDDKSLPKQERKRLQILSASHKSPEAKCIKIADKISNVRDVGEYPPVFWTKERLKEYLNWSEKVVAGLRGANPALESLYDSVLEKSKAAVDARPED